MSHEDIRVGVSHLSPPVGFPRDVPFPFNIARGLGSVNGFWPIGKERSELKKVSGLTQWVVMGISPSIKEYLIRHQRYT